MTEAASTKFKKTDVTTWANRVQSHPIQRLDIPMLTPDNWTDWQFCVRTKLGILGMSEIVFGEPEDDAKDMSELARLDKLLLSLLMLRIDESIRREYYHVKTVSELWTKLEERFEGDENTKAMKVFKMLVDMIEYETQDLAKFVSEFSAFYRELQKLFPNLDTRPFVGLLYALLPKSVRFLPSVFRAQKDVTVSKVLDHLVQEQRLYEDKGKTVNNRELANAACFNLNVNSKVIVCEFCGKKGHTIKKCFKRRDLKKRELDDAESSSEPIDRTRNRAKNLTANNLTVYGF